MEIKSNTKIRVRLESFNHELLVSSCKKIIESVNNIPLSSVGMITLPTAKRIYCVLRSPHVDKDSREHFEIRTHKRVLEISHDTETNVIDRLMDITLPSGILYSICLS